jgi:hypothetical protein
MSPISLNIIPPVGRSERTRSEIEIVARVGRTGVSATSGSVDCYPPIDSSHCTCSASDGDASRRGGNPTRSRRRLWEGFVFLDGEWASAASSHFVAAMMARFSCPVRIPGLWFSLSYVLGDWFGLRAVSMHVSALMSAPGLWILKTKSNRLASDVFHDPNSLH